jgi:hypothetical protein
MGHAIEALIIPDTVAGLVPEMLPHTRAVSLGHGLRIVPITAETFDALRERFPSLEDPPDPEFWKLSGPIAYVAEELSQHGAIAYIETDYFGGTGLQAATVWESRSVRMPPTRAKRGPINAALRVMGVRGRFMRDEFEIVGLGMHRSNDDWLDLET